MSIYVLTADLQAKAINRLNETADTYQTAVIDVMSANISTGVYYQDDNYLHKTSDDSILVDFTIKDSRLCEKYLNRGRYCYKCPLSLFSKRCQVGVWGALMAYYENKAIFNINASDVAEAVKYKTEVIKVKNSMELI